MRSNYTTISFHLNILLLLLHLMSKSIFNSPNYLFQLHVTELKRHSFVLFNRAVTSQTITQVSLTIIGGMVILLLPSLLPSF